MKKKIITISVISFFSIGLWVYVSLSNVFVTTIKVPINITDLPKNYSLGNSSVSEVYIQVKGKGWELAKLILGPEVDFDISAHRRIGHRKNDLNDLIEANAWLTSSFQVLEITPSQIEYDIEKVGSKTVKLIKNFKLDFKPGYGPSSKIKIVPETVEISGPANLLRNTDSIKTEYKKIPDVSENVKFDLKIEAPDGITVSTKICTIELEVQKIVDKTFENIVVETRNVPPSKDLILFPGKINVVIRGGINKLGRLTNDSIKAYVDYWSALREEKGTIEPIIELPQFTTHVSTIPNKLEYIIKQY
ncbi:MAG: CdaR family protein [Ignavibacteriales bacterium]|nr:CdaR family protein [Ignavibacteriales bacterium]